MRTELPASSFLQRRRGRKQEAAGPGKPTRDHLVLGQGQQRYSGLPQVQVPLLLVEVKHVELKHLGPQVPVQSQVHRDRVGLEVVELGVTALVYGGGGIVGEGEELVEDERTRLLQGSGLKVRAALDGDEELVPPAV